MSKNEMIMLPREVAEQALEALLNEGEFRKLLEPLIEKSIDSIRDALEQPDAGPTATTPEGWKLVPVELTHEMLRAGRDSHYEAEKRIQDQDAWSPGGFAKRAVRAAHVFQAMLAAAPQPTALEQVQANPSPYLWYDPENGDTWTQEAVDEGFCATDSLIPLYENQSNTKGKK